MRLTAWNESANIRCQLDLDVEIFLQNDFLKERENPMWLNKFFGASLLIFGLATSATTSALAWMLPDSPYAGHWARVDARMDKGANPSFDLCYFYDGSAEDPINLCADAGVNISEGVNGSYGPRLAWLEAGHGGWSLGSTDLYLMGGLFFGEGSTGDWTLLSVAPEFYAYYVVSPWDIGNWTNAFLDVTGENVPTVWWNRTYATLRAATDHLFVGPQVEWNVAFEKGANTGWLYGPRALVKVQPDRWHFELFGYQNNLTHDLGARITLLAYVP